MFRIAAGARRRRDAEHNERVWAVWHIAALQRVRRLPQLKSLMIEPDQHMKRAHTWQQQFAVLRQMADMPGGKS